MLISQKLILFGSLISICLASELYGINPDRNYQMTPDSLGLKHESLHVETPDGYNIKVWALHPEKSDAKKTMVLAYGDAGNMSYYLRQAAMLARKGFTVVLFDYRGFGESSDFDMDLDYLYYDEFSTDLVTVRRWAQENIDSEKTGVWGLSMGALIGTIALQQTDAAFLIAEDLVVDPMLIKERLETDEIEIKLPDSANDVRLLQKTLHLPVLVFAGEKDEVTTVDDSKLFTGEKDNRKLIVFNGGHLQGMRSMSTEKFAGHYFDEIVTFTSQL